MAAHLEKDARLKDILKRHPGLRVPGCWDGFEIAVRAVLGQQVSVKGATTLAGRLAAEFGSGIYFPTASALADADLGRIGLTKKRAETIREMACAVVRGELVFDGSLELDLFEEKMTALPGIGPWTAQYIAMRLGEPDAFPGGDLYLRDAARGADAWRPWRAYAAMYWWKMSHQKGEKS